MKILYVNTVCGIGSTGTIVTDLMELLRERGDSVKVAFGFGDAQNVQVDEAFKMTTPAGYYLHNALTRLTDKAGLYSRKETKALIRQIEEFDPDVIHLHNLHGYYLNYEVLFQYLAESKQKVIWTLHDCWPFTGHCTHFLTVGCDQWKHGCIRCKQLKEYPICYLWGNVRDNYIRKKAVFTGLSNITIVTPSDWLRELVEQSFLNRYAVKTITNGINTELYRPGNSDFRIRNRLMDQKILLGVASPWSRRKGLQDFIELARMLHEDQRIVLVGVSEAQTKALPERIIALPRIDEPRKLAEIYASADVFVNPTYEDNYPTVNLEAQACGTPVVSYDVGGCAQTIVNGFGTVVPCGDLQALWEQIQRLLFAPPTVEIDEVRKRLCKRTCYKKYLDLYDSLLE